MRHAIALLKFLLVMFTLPSFVAVAFWLGLVPARIIPFAPIDLARDDQWFVDLRLAALKSNAKMCQSALKQPVITADPIADVPFENGCGWSNAVAVKDIAGAKLSAAQVSCPMAGALAMWFEHEVQPAALAAFGVSVSHVRHMGTYACRNIIGAKGLKTFRSQHASANAIDISAFTLADGRTITVAKHYRGKGPESDFLHSIHRGACPYFRVAVGPDFNEAHHDHLHLDRGAFTSCR